MLKFQSENLTIWTLDNPIIMYTCSYTLELHTKKIYGPAKGGNRPMPPLNMPLLLSLYKSTQDLPTTKNFLQAPKYTQHCA